MMQLDFEVKRPPVEASSTGALGHALAEGPIEGGSRKGKEDRGRRLVKRRTTPATASGSRCREQGSGEATRSARLGPRPPRPRLLFKELGEIRQWSSEPAKR